MSRPVMLAGGVACGVVGCLLAALLTPNLFGAQTLLHRTGLGIADVMGLIILLGCAIACVGFLLAAKKISADGAAFQGRKLIPSVTILIAVAVIASGHNPIVLIAKGFVFLIAAVTMAVLYFRDQPSQGAR